MNSKKKGIKILGICTILLIAFSCVKDVDFDQADDFKLEPVFELDFVYSRISPPKFTSEIGAFMPVLNDTLQDEFFSGDVGDKLLRAELFMSLENTIAASFEAELQFLDANNVEIPISTSPIFISIGAGANGNGAITERTYIITLEDLEFLKNAKQLTSRVRIINGDNTLGGELILQSKAIYYTSLLDE